MVSRRSDEPGDGSAKLTRAQTMELCARLASYAEAGSTPAALVLRAGAEAVRRFPKDVDVLVAAGRMYLMAEELTEAESTLRMALRSAPREPHALRMLGEVLLRRGDPSAAHQALSTSVACGMSDPWTKQWVARALDYAELLDDLGPEGVARDVRQVLGRPGQGPPEDDRRLAQAAAPTSAGRGAPKRPVVGKIDKGIYFAGDPRAEEPVPSGEQWGLRPGEILDLPTPVPADVVPSDAHDAGVPSVPGGLHGALGDDAAWDDAEPTIDGAPPSDTEVSAWIPDVERASPARASSPRSQPRAPQPRAPQPRASQPQPRRSRSTDPPPPGHAFTGRVAPAPPGLPRLSAGELYDEFTEQRKPFVRPAEAGREAPAPQQRQGRRVPPPLPPEPADDELPPGRAGPPPLPADLTSTWSNAPAVRVHETAPHIAVLGGDEPGPMTAPPSALLPLDERGESYDGQDFPPPTAPASALLPPEPPSLLVPSAAQFLGKKKPGAPPSSDPARASAPAAEGGPAAAPAAAPSRKRLRLQALALRALAALALVAALLGGYELYKRNRTTKVRAYIAQAASALDAGGPRGVIDADVALAGARAIDPKSRSVRMVVVKARFFDVLDVDATHLPQLLAAVEEATKAGIRSSDMSYVEVLRASATNDAASAAEIITHHDQDPERAADALYQLAAGAAVEAFDAPTAIERYRAAVKLEPRMMSAQIRLVRALAFSGSTKAAREALAALSQAWPDRRETDVLAAILTSAEGGAPVIDPPADPETLPRPLRAAARALSKGAGEQSVAKATSEADTAPIVVLCGEAALRGGHEARAREAAQRAIEITTSYPPAYALASRVALASGRFEEARQAALRAPPDVAAEVLSLIAYEAMDLAAMRSAAGRRAEGPRTEPVSAGLARLAGAAPLQASTISTLARSNKTWGDVIAMDAALDAGDLPLAQEIAAGWPGGDRHPVRAARVARLLRYQGKNGAANAAAMSATPTLAARIEAALAAAEMASARDAVASAMQSGRTNEERWTAVFLLAREGRAGPARLLMRTLAFPDSETPLLSRVVVALALAELHIKSNVPMFASLDVWAQNPDVARALASRAAAPSGGSSDSDPY